MTKPPDAQQVYAEVDKLLDHEIEARILAGVWRHDKRMYAQHVLDERALKRAEAAQAEQTGIARSAKNAAWAAAIFAAIAALAAVIALVKAILG